MQAQQTRVIRTARIMYRQFTNPMAVAYNRSREARTERTHMFWHCVGDYLFKPHKGMAWTDADMQRWNIITAR